MLLKSIKYFLIAIANMIILTLLLFFWIDDIQVIFDTPLIVPIEFIKLLGLTIFVIIGLRLLVSFFRKQNINQRTRRIKYSILLTVILSSYFYINYSIKAFQNQIWYRQTRKEVIKKFKDANYLAYGTRADSLTIDEYNAISASTWLPMVPKTSRNISFLYTYDGFLPDYVFKIQYEVPIDERIDILEITEGHFNKFQTYKIVDNKKKVTYSEGIR